MKHRIFALVAIGVLSAGLSVQSATTPALAGPVEDKQAITEIWKAYSAARVAGDAEGWLALWDDGGIQMPPGAPARGKDVLDKVVPKAFSAGKVSSMSVNPEEIVIAGDWAYSRGNYTSERMAEGQTMMIDGKFMTILKRQSDGGWKIYRDIFNSNTK